MRDEDFNKFFGDQDPPDALTWVILAGGVITALLLVWLFASEAHAFPLPAYHLVFQKDGAQGISIEDMTLSECKARAKTFKPSAHAKCVLAIGQREYT